MTDHLRVRRYVWLLLIDFGVAFVGANAGIKFFFWYATIQCGH